MRRGNFKIMKVIICDDEKSTCSELEDIILKYAKEKSVPFATEVFFQGILCWNF